MNWTGGTRVRHSRPSSDTHRLQKRYFAKVRAAQSSIYSVTHAGPSSVLGAEDSANSHVKRKRPPIPALDIIVQKDGDASQGVATKRRRLLEVTCGVGTSTPASSVQSFGNVGRGSGGLRSKKQLLLETDNWVCTTLARPLVLKNQADEPSGRRRTAGAKVVKPLGLDLCEPTVAPVHFHETRDAESETTTHSTPIYLSPERRTYLNTGEDGNRRVARAFRNLSDGGYVQIGGSTQVGNRTATPYSFGERGSVQRGMSSISEETMLFDLDSRRVRYETPPQPSPFSTQPMSRRRANEIFGNEYQAPCVQDGSEDIIYYPRDSRWKRVGRDRDVADQFPSSPLAPYSQNIHNQGKLLYINPFLADGQEPTDSLTEEIEKAVADADADPSSPRRILPTIRLRPEPVTPPPRSQITLPPAGRNIRQNSEYQGRSCSRYPTYGRHQVLAPNGLNFFGLNRVCEEGIEGTQNLSLVAYASSSGSAFADNDDEDGGSWMLGSNVSPEPYEKYDDNTSVSLRESDDDWETFLRDGVLAGGEGVEHEGAKDDAQSYLDQLGIWEKQPEDVRGQALVENQCSDNEEEYRDFYDRGVDFIPVISVASTNSIPDPRELSAATPGLCLRPEEEEDKSASWGDFLEEPLEEPLEESCGIGDDVVGHKSPTGKQRTAERRLDPCGVNNETTVETSAIPREIKNVINNKSAPALNLDGDEDRAWRIFVFGGLDDKPDQESIKALERPRPKSLKKSSLKPISQFSRVKSPGLQLPSPSQRSSSIQPPDVQSTAGATVGSGSLPDSGDGTSAVGTPTAGGRFKFFDTSLTSSPAASPVCARPERLEAMGRRRGEKRLITGWLGGCLTNKKGGNKEMKGENDQEGETDLDENRGAKGIKVDAIEEW